MNKDKVELLFRCYKAVFLFRKKFSLKGANDGIRRKRLDPDKES